MTNAIRGLVFFVAGTLATFLIAYNLLIWLVPPNLPPPDPNDADLVSMAKWAHYLNMLILSAIIAIVGGFGIALLIANRRSSSPVSQDRAM